MVAVPAAALGALSGFGVIAGAWLAKEKSVVALLLVLIALSISLSGVLTRVDHLIFDVGQRLNSRSAAEGIAIVAVDEASLERIGRWPWSRDVHARLLNTLCAARPAVIGFDIAFSERSAEPAADAALAQAMANCGNVVLPLVIETPGAGGQLLESPPISELASVAAGLGRVGVRLDEDGIARAVDLREGVGSASWPLLAEELLRVADSITKPVPGNAWQEGGFGLKREDSRRLEFAGPPGTLPRISYAQLLEGNVPPATFAGKTVLIGATAVGLGDFLPTPVSAQAQPMSGVEVQANVWLSMRDKRLITLVPAWASALLCTVLSVVPLFWLPRLMPLPGLLLSTLWILMLGLIGGLLPGWSQLWFAPSGALVAGLAAFPLWSWRRLEAARRHLDQELRQLGADGLGTKPPVAMRRLGFEQRIAWVQAAQRRMQHLETQRNEALAFISHDLRSPLASAVQRLEIDPVCNAAQLLPPLRRAQAMAQDFLQLARAEALDSRQMKVLDLGAVLHQATDELYAQAQQRGQHIVRMLPDESVWVRGDFDALERCAINLLQNALTYGPEGVPIAIGLEPQPGGIRFWVENEGDELGEDQISRLFQRFSRGPGGASNPASSGLGLYYVRTVAEKHGGRAGLECHCGKIRFWVVLPDGNDARLGCPA